MKPIKKYIINTLIVITIFLIICQINNISPFGNNMIGTSDGVDQFKPFLYDFIMKIKTGTLLNYSFNNGLGNPFIFNYLYYLSGPLNLIAILFNDPDKMYLSVLIIRLILCTLTSTFYFSKKTNNNYIVFICTIAYVYCSWFISYYFFIPWLDIYALFPLYQYSLEKLLNEKKYHLYIICLSLLLLSNFYLSISVCFYTIAYFIISELIISKKSIKEKILSFDRITLSTLYSFMIIFLLLFIIYKSFLKIGLSTDSTIIEYETNFLHIIKTLFYGNNDIMGKEKGITSPNIACISLIIINIILYIFNNKIDKKNKITTLLLTAFCTFCIFSKKIDFILNGFHQVRGLTYRYSFIFIFLMIVLACKNLANYEHNIKKIIVSFIIISILLFSIKSITNSNILFLNILFLISYFICLITYNNNKYHKLLICFIASIQVFTILNITLFSKEDKEAYDLNYSKTSTTYRLNAVRQENYKYNENLYSNKSVTTLYSSMTYSKIISLFDNLGCNSYSSTIAVCIDKDETFSLLFNVKNGLNNYQLEKIYTVNDKIKNTMIYDDQNKQNQENIIKSMTNIEDIFDEHKIIPIKKGNKYYYFSNYDYYFIEYYKDKINEIALPTTAKYFTETTNEKKEYATIYTLNQNKLEEIYNYLKKKQIKYSYYKDNHIKGTITTNKNELIFTSIPYDPDWQIYIDNKKVKPIVLLDSLIGIETTPGTHKLEMKYKSNYTIPALISIISTILFVIDLLRKNR